MSLEFHPLANLFPLIEGEEFDALVAGMRADGFRSGEEIILYEGKILDGRNRYRAAVAAGIIEEGDTSSFIFAEFGTKGVDGIFTDAEVAAGPLAFVLSKNLHRRHLNESQRATVAARLASMRQGERTDLRGADLKPANLPEVAVSQADAAKALVVSERSVRHAKVVLEHGAPELVAAVDQGKMAVSLAAQAAKLPAPMQAKVIEEVQAGRANAVRTVVKRELRNDKEKRLADKQKALPAKRFGVIYADPEWRFEPRSRETGMDRSPDNHYPTSPTAEIAARPVGDIASEDCVLFLWATVPMLPDALTVMEAWGFRYVSQCVWVKDRPGEQRGPGYWFTVEHEILLVGTRGNIPAPALGTQWRSVIIAPVGEHSEKPDVFYELIESYYPNLPKIELNARRARAGWEGWGNELPEIAALQSAIAEQHSELVLVGETNLAAPTAVEALEAIFGQAGDEAGVELRDGETVIVAGPTLCATDDFDLDRDMPDFLRRNH